ncbi:MAG: CNNM domain-containing protein [Planctomycetaceae bacterium]
MSHWMQIIFVVGMFAAGLRLSAFFSGSETGFYRLSLPRLGIDAQSGDALASRLLWFAHRPSQFVATTLVGNNVANYLTTLAITHGTVLAVGGGSEVVEVLATLAISPVIFLFGELLPKNVYYRAPLAHMRTQIKWFQLFYWLALPASWPLVLLTRGIEKLLGKSSRSQEMLPGRGRFLQMISHGHREGLLSQAQSTMATGVLSIAARAVQESMTPTDRVLGVSEAASRDEILEFARRFGVPVVPLHAVDSALPETSRRTAVSRWTSYVRVGELRVLPDPVSSLRQPMPTFPPTATKLEALSLLHERNAYYGAIVSADGTVLGTISQRGLIEQLFRPPMQGRTIAVE